MCSSHGLKTRVTYGVVVFLGIGFAAILACALDRVSATGPVAARDGQPRPEARSIEKSDPQPVAPEPNVAAAPRRNDQTAPLAAAGSSLSADSSLARGQALFAKQCAICHGDTGDGAGKFAYLMNPRPRNLQQGKFKLATTENQIPTDDDLLRTISRGMPGSAMPPWGHLPRSDLEALVEYVRQLNVEATRRQLQRDAAEGSRKPEELETELARRTQPDSAVRVPPEPAFDEVRWFRGRRIYLESCASCHGVDGNPVAEEIKEDEEGYPVPPRSFVNGIFKGGSEGHQLYARIAKGMRGTPMPASEGNYAPDEMWDLIHYVQSLARAGAQERAQLGQGTITAPNIRGPLPDGPTDAAWDQARPLYVGLTPLWWTEERVEGIVVQALHNGEDLALRFSWIDPTLDDSGVRQTEFRDAVGVQFSLTSDPPFYMGDPGKHGGVNIWMWKADREKNIKEGYQDVDALFPHRAVDIYPEQSFRITQDASVTEWPLAKITEHNPQFITAWGAGNLVANPNLNTPVECLVARGPGTLSGKPPNVQLVKGQAVYERGVWFVQLERTMDLPHGHDADEGDERHFRPGDYLPVSFAIWNGSAGDRDGKKNISIWQKLVIE